MEDSNWLQGKTEVKVKGDRYNLKELIGDGKIAQKYLNGSGIVCFLLPHNYHRFHSPLEGNIVYKKDIDGLYFGTKGFLDYFHSRRRSVYEIKSKYEKHIAIVAVGIATISSVKLKHNEGQNISKGQELGHFEYGGSTLILLFEPKFLKNTILKDDQKVSIKMGEELGILNKFPAKY